MAGAHPSFSEVHLIRTIIALQTRTGRKKLLRKIGIGEGSMRTILNKLKKRGFIDSTKKGHKLTVSGLECLDKYLKKFTAPFKIYAEDIVEGRKAGIIARNVSGKITTGVRERDTAVRMGALGALVLKYDAALNKLKFPDDVPSVDDFPGFKSEIENLDIDFNPGDVLVVAFSDDCSVSENAALEIALALVNHDL